MYMLVSLNETQGLRHSVCC